MAETPETNAPAEAEVKSDIAVEQTGPLLPRAKTWGTALAFWLIGSLVYWTALTGDHAIDKIILWIGSLVAFLILGIWFVWFSGYGRLVRWVSATAVPLSILVFGICFRVEGVGGEMGFRFAPRWAPPHDSQLEVPQESSDAQAEDLADLATTTPDDFPQFLGPNRNQYVGETQLQTDWKSHPPKLVWRQPIGAGWSGFAIVNGFAVTLEQRGENELVTCYQVADGELVWSVGEKTRYQNILGGIGPRSTPTIDQGRVFALGATGILRCIDGNSGTLVWKQDLPKYFKVPSDVEASTILYGRSASPLVTEKLVIVPAGGPTQATATALVAFDKLTGEEIWRGGKDQIAYASPARAKLLGVDQAIIVNESSITGHAISDGTQLWSEPWPGSSNADASNSQAIAVSSDEVFVSKAYGVGATLLKLTPGDNGGVNVSRTWHERSRMKTKFTNVVIHQGYVYGLSDGILECIKLSTGEKMWKKGRYRHGQILGVGNVLLVINEKSGVVTMVSLNPEKHEELGEFLALEEGQSWNHLAISGPYLLVRNDRQAACWKLPLKQ